jgi:hypothetical protein
MAAPPPLAPPPAEESAVTDTIIGVTLSVVANVLINLGTNMLKLAHKRLEAAHEAKLEEAATQTERDEVVAEGPTPAYKYWVWQLGFFVFKFGNILNFVAFGFAAQSLLSALASVQFISNVLFAAFVLQEPVSRRTIVGTLGIVVGVTLLIIFGAKTGNEYTAKELLGLFAEPTFLMYYLSLVVVALGAFTFYVRHVHGHLPSFVVLLRPLPHLRQLLTRARRGAKGRKRIETYLPFGNEAFEENQSRKTRPSLMSVMSGGTEVESSIDGAGVMATAAGEERDDVPMMANPMIARGLMEEGDEKRNFEATSGRRVDLDEEVFSDDDDDDEDYNGLEDYMGDDYELEAAEEEWVDLSPEQKRVRTMLPLCFALFSAVPGTPTVTFAKMVAVLVKMTATGQSQLASPMFYLFILGLIVTGIFWDRQINSGLKQFDAAIIVPTMHAMWILLCICNGGVFFHEFASLSPMSSGMFALGMCIVLLATIILAQPPPKEKNVTRSREMTFVLRPRSGSDVNIANAEQRRAALQSRTFKGGAMRGGTVAAAAGAQPNLGSPASTFSLDVDLDDAVFDSHPPPQVSPTGSVSRRSFSDRLESGQRADSRTDRALTGDTFARRTSPRGSRDRYNTDAFWEGGGSGHRRRGMSDAGINVLGGISLGFSVPTYESVRETASRRGKHVPAIFAINSAGDEVGARLGALTLQDAEDDAGARAPRGSAAPRSSVRGLMRTSVRSSPGGGY